MQDARGPDRCSRERPPAARGLVPRARRLAPRARRLALGPSAGGERCLFPRLFQMRETRPLRREEEKCIHQTVMIAVKLQLLKEPHGQTVPLHPEQQPGAARTPAGLACAAHSAAGAGSPQLARPSSPTFPSWAEPRSSPFSCPSPLRISPTCAIPGLSPGDIAGPPAARGSGSFGSGLRWAGGRDSPGGNASPLGSDPAPLPVCLSRPRSACASVVHGVPQTSRCVVKNDCQYGRRQGPGLLGFCSGLFLTQKSLSNGRWN